ncbi:MAG: ATP-binding protein [Rhodoferax sp.]
MRSSAFLFKLRVVFGISIVLVVIVAIASFFTINRLIEAAHARLQTEELLVLLEQVGDSIKALDSSAQRYVLSGTTKDLQVYQQTRVAARGAIARLRTTHLLPEQGSMDELARQRRMLADQMVAARESAGQQGGLAIFNSDLSQQLKRRTDDLLEAARVRETQELKDEQATDARNAQWSQWLIIAVALLLVGVLASMVLMFKLYEARRASVEAQLRNSDERFRALTRLSTDWFWEQDENFRYVRISGDKAGAAASIGASIIGKTRWELDQAGNDDSVWAAHKAQLERHEVFRGFQMALLTPNGQIVYASISGAPIFDASGRFTGYRGTGRDNTAMRLASEALRASEFQLRQIIDAVPALIAYIDVEQRFRLHNRACEETIGLSFGQIDGHTLVEVFGQQTYDRVREKIEEVLSGYPVRHEGNYVTPQGHRRTYAMQYFPRYGEGSDEGRVLGFFFLGTDITELKRIDQLKTEFVSTVSHELRTPLTSIRGSLGLISSGVAGELPEAVKNLVSIANSNCERLIRLINDILDSEKIESGKMRLDLHVTDIRQLLTQALVANKGFSDQHKVAVQMHAPNAPLRVRVDSDRMIQVLTNLLSNAVKFSPPDQAVELKVSRVAQSVRVEVSDHGPGIAQEFRSRIFQKFSQADTSDSRQKGGTGLGLNISKALIEQMGGSVGFTSEVGVGTTFFFEVPEWHDRKPPQRSSRAKGSPIKAPILICENDPVVAKLIAMTLTKAEFPVDIAHSAEQALACLARRNYGAMTLDLRLPGQNNIAFISAVRGAERTRYLPVIVISDLADERRREFNRKHLKVSDWLQKPIDEDLLIRAVRRAVAGSQAGKPRILHVEDDLDVQRVTAAVAQDFASVEFAATVDEARTLLREQRFDLVMLDPGLNNESGWDLVQDIDALDQRPPVIVFSASDVDPEESKHAQAVLLKADTSNGELLSTIQRLLRIPGDPGPTQPQPLI